MKRRLPVRALDERSGRNNRRVSTPEGRIPLAGQMFMEDGMPQAPNRSTRERNNGSHLSKIADALYPKNAQQAKESPAAKVANAEKSEAYDTYVKTGGSRSWRNNNPGNLEYHGQEGATGTETAGRFAKFASEEDGMNALKEALKTVYKDRTVDQMIKKYAPKGDGHNDPDAYRKFLEQHGVDMKKTVGQQVDAVAAAIKKQEGWIPGTIKQKK